MLVDLPPLVLVLVNVVAIPAIHLGVSWAFLRMPASWFRPGHWLFRERSWEQGGAAYQKVLRVRAWKRFLPDAAPWFRGFAKGSLRAGDPEYLRTFVVETCRGEAAHYAQIPALAAVMLWNPWPVAALVIGAYAFASNLPCIILQRFTRRRLEKTRLGRN